MSTDEIDLYYVEADTEDGNRRDLLVLASSIERAARHWIDHYELTQSEAAESDPMIFLVIPGVDLHQEDLDEGPLRWPTGQPLPIPADTPTVRD